MKIRIIACDISVKQKDTDLIELVKGRRDYTLYFFKDPVLVKTKIGLHDVDAGDCILIAPGFPHYIKSKGKQWNYDALSFKGSDASRLVNQIGIETNEIHSPLQSYFIDALLEKISKECRALDMLWDRVVASTLDELLTKIIRFSKQDFVLSMPDHSQKLRDLRSEIHESFHLPWTIKKMADKLGLSCSRFASLYKQEFKTSPTEDLIKTRIIQAKKMLSATKVSVKQVSVACGFESVHYFHRAFKKRIDITPKHYQNFKLSMKGSVPTEEKSFTLDGLSIDSDFSGTMEIVNGEIVFHGNDSEWSDFLGYPTDVLKGKPFLNFICPQDLDIGREAVSNIIDNQNIKDVTLKLVKNDDSLAKIEFSAITKGNTWFWFAKKILVDD
ncbi:MAG: helix-turn-helix transcriptional regulator [Opitutae bacterium]|nr:helix-turn-helix transcriptional regulator [Opitutae bacterium]